MRTLVRTVVTGSLSIALLAIPSLARGEIVEEIVAWVNGDVITLSEYETEEEARVAEVYRRFSGAELDSQLEVARRSLLLGLIDRKILVHHAQALGYDTEKMGESFLEGFMEQQGIDSIEEFERLASDDGMTLDDVKKRLVELYAPDEVVRFEVTNRVSVSDAEIEAHYAANHEQYLVNGEVQLREIVLLADTDEKKAERRPRAEELRRRAATGESFAALAREFSESGTAAAGGVFGPLKQGELSETLAGPAFSLPEGGVSEVMETPYGFHIITVKSRIDDHARPLKEVRDDIRRGLEDQKFATEFNSFMERARSESEWCVRPKHQSLLSIPAPPACERL